MTRLREALNNTGYLPKCVYDRLPYGSYDDIGRKV